MKLRVVLITLIALAVVAVLILRLTAWPALIGEGGRPERDGVDTLTVEPGATAPSVARQLAEMDLIDHPTQFVWYLRLRGLDEQLKAGIYVLQRSAGSPELADVLTRGAVARTSVTFPEGWRAEQMGARLEAAGVTDSAAFVDSVHSASFTRTLGFTDLPTLEGMLFPETYVFVLQSDPGEIAGEMVDHFRDRMGPAWLDSARADPFGLRGVLTLASIVEGEINLEDEADEVAAVYRNRLDRGMKLEADPTVQYLLDEPRRLLLDDLTVDSPYNTYLYKGLPPGPINNPGEAALRAAVRPPEHPWLFMVATGDGGHTFTTTYDDHLRAKAEFDAYRRRVARQQRQQNP